jgi:hypothetical protein
MQQTTTKTQKVTDQKSEIMKHYQNLANKTFRTTIDWMKSNDQNKQIIA